MTLNLVSTYAPVLLGTSLIKTFGEEGRELPIPIQLSDSVGGGMISGVAHSYILHAANIIKAARAQRAPGQSLGQSIKSHIQTEGLGIFKRSFRDHRIDMFAKGAGIGGAYFVADQSYKAYKKYSAL